MKLKGSLTTPTCGRFYGKKLNLVVLSQLVGFFNSLIKRNLTPAGNYSPTQAHMFAKERQEWKNKARAKLTNAMKADIVQCIVEHKWSPEQIAGRRKLEGKPMVGKTSIYKFLH